MLKCVCVCLRWIECLNVKIVVVDRDDKYFFRNENLIFLNFMGFVIVFVNGFVCWFFSY